MKLNIPSANDSKEQSIRNYERNMKVLVEFGINRAVSNGEFTFFLQEKLPDSIAKSLRDLGYRVNEYTTKTQIAWS